jgi:hypothetical protein
VVELLVVVVVVGRTELEVVVARRADGRVDVRDGCRCDDETRHVARHGDQRRSVGWQSLALGALRAMKGPGHTHPRCTPVMVKTSLVTCPRMVPM